MRNGGHEESIQEEHGVDQSLDVGKILGEPQPVDVDLKAKYAVQSPVEALGEELVEQRASADFYRNRCHCRLLTNGPNTVDTSTTAEGRTPYGRVTC